ncbi:hypothetical protein EAF07_08565 [Streptococcus hillyeri]|uniref:Uncharacterized protein n=1 Tax=Streptococcus hillyeri TaxID=2282420 RepID=A0A3L9DT61_9STRE|nr:hypothetical protein EAF07_08565 [Streptococcus hillyeri]
MIFLGCFLVFRITYYVLNINIKLNDTSNIKAYLVHKKHLSLKSNKMNIIKLIVYIATDKVFQKKRRTLKKVKTAHKRY